MQCLVRWLCAVNSRAGVIRNLTSMAGRQQNLPVLTTNDQQTGVEAILPGYTYLSYDRAGHPSMQSVALHTEEARLPIYSPAIFDRVPENPDAYQGTMLCLFRERILFLISTSYEIFPALYSKNNLYSDIKISDTLINVGRKSYQHLSEAVSLRTGDMLHRSVSQVVTADLTTRRPALIPDTARQHMDRVCQTYPSEKVQVLQKADSTYQMEYTTLWSDTDHYFHTNHSSYMRVCFDAMVLASLSGTYSLLKGDIARQKVTSAKCLFQKETNPGDRLTIHVWENINDPWLIHAAAETDGQPVFQYSVRFMADHQSKL